MGDTKPLDVSERGVSESTVKILTPGHHHCAIFCIFVEWRHFRRIIFLAEIFSEDGVEMPRREVTPLKRFRSPGSILTPGGNRVSRYNHARSCQTHYLGEDDKDLPSAKKVKVKDHVLWSVDVRTDVFDSRIGGRKVAVRAGSNHPFRVCWKSTLACRRSTQRNF